MASPRQRQGMGMRIHIGLVVGLFVVGVAAVGTADQQAGAPPPGITRTELVNNATALIARLRMAPGAREDVHTHPFSAVVVQIGAGVLLGLPFAGALCYEFLELTGSGGSVPGAVAMASVLGVSVLLLVSVTACTVPTLRALRIAPVDALRKEG